MFLLRRDLRVLIWALLAVSLHASAADAPSDVSIPGAELHAPHASEAVSRQQWREILQWPDSCEENFSDVTGYGGVYLYPVSESRYAVSVACETWAYQGLSRVYLVSVNDGTTSMVPLTFSVAEEGGTAGTARFEKREEVVGTLLVDAPKGHLVVHRRYSGFGDCGTYSVYDLRKGAPELVELRAQFDCEAEPRERDPLRWPEIGLE